MKRSVLSAAISFCVALSMGICPSEALASKNMSSQPQASQDSEGTPDVNKGIDLDRLQDAAYVESLSSVAEQLSSLASDVRVMLGNSPDLVDFGYLTGIRSLIVYWSGDQNAPILSRVAQLASEHGLGLVIAPRKVSRAQLDVAEARVAANLKSYKAMGISVSAFGGFAADFDGITLTVNEQKSLVKDRSAVERDLQSGIGIPVAVSFANVKNLSGKYDDFSPFNAGGAMVDLPNK